MSTVEQQIRAIQSQGVFPVGKYFGQSITDIMVSDPGYIIWISKKAQQKDAEVCQALVYEFDNRPLRELQAYKKALQRIDKEHKGDIFDVKYMLDLINSHKQEEMDK